ncbi:MAG: AMP-dependent synthetase/ligase [Candidatus Zixiibacteriota bacterium]
MPSTTPTKIDPNDNLFKSFFRSALVHGDRIIFKAHGGKGKSYSYKVVLELVTSFGAGLQAECPHESEIGLLSENRPEWPISYLAILSAGKTVVPIDVNLKPDEIKHIIEHSKIKTLIISDKVEKEYPENCPKIRLISFSETSRSNWQNYFRVKTESAKINPHQVASLIYTSGTTGAPKAVMLTHANLLSNLNSIEQCLSFGEDDVFLSVLPLHHTFESTAGFITPVNFGARIVYARSLKSKEIVEDIKHNGVTIMCGVPLLFEKMYISIMHKINEASLLKRVMFKLLFALSSFGWKLKMHWGRFLFRSMRNAAGLGSIRLFVCGGAPLPDRIAAFFNLIGFTFLEGYGMTECSPVISVNRPENLIFGSVGPVLPGLEVRIHNPDENGNGEIIVRGPSVTPGYKNNPEKTAELIQNGWLRTGDLGKFAHGHLWITGRAKNLIISAAGKNIYPEEIEEKLMLSPYILEALVIGRKKESKQGEEVRAIIVPDLEQFTMQFQMPSDKPDLVKINAVIAQEVSKTNAAMSDYKRINSFELRLAELEKTSTKKVKRFVYG